MKLRGAELRAAILTMMAHLATGATDSEVAAEMGLTVAEYDELKIELYRQESAAIQKRGNEDWYINYELNQRRNIADLTAMIAEFKKSRQYNAMVGAVRTRSDIQSNLIKVAADMGFIRKAPERKEVFAGVVIAEMSPADLKQAIAKEVRGLSAMMGKYTPEMMSEVEPGEIHRAPPKTKALPARARKGHGRKVVKTKVTR